MSDFRYERQDPRAGYSGYRGGSYENQSYYDSGSWSGGSYQKPPKRKKAKKPSPPITLTRRSLAYVLIGCMLISCLFGFAGAKLANLTTSSPYTSTDKPSHASDYELHDATGSNMSISEITDAALNSVVEIKTESVSSDSWMQQYVTEGAGSGVIISEDGYIITNNHVISGASSITVTLTGGEEYDASLVGTDSINDIAVLKIDARGLSPAKYGNSEQLSVGDLAVAIGNPLGELGGTVTAGIISATDRELVIDGKTMTLLQTDSSINPGNSGGGLFNSDGQLIGIVVAKSSGSDIEGLGFAIPINTAADVASQIINKGYVSNQPWTGMTYTEGSSGFDSFFGSAKGTVYIYSVDSREAKAAGFKSGDMVFAVNDEEISSIDDLSVVVTRHEVGDKLIFTIVRDGNTLQIPLKLQERKGQR